MTDELYEATKREVMTEEEEYRNADVPMPKKQELDKDFIEHLEKFFKGKKIIDRDRGTNLATGVSLDLSDEGISKPEQRLSALEGRVPDVVSPLTKMKFREHLKKFFKGEK